MNATLTHHDTLEAPPRAGLISVDGRLYPLESAALEARAGGGMAMSVLRQRFRNPHPESLEVIYTLPLPADGAVLGYVVRVGERRIVGEVRPREEAEEAYRAALYQGRTAGLLEQDRADTFQQRLGNIPGETAVEVEIRVLHPLAFRSADREWDGQHDLLIPEGASPAWSTWEYRFPTTVGVRYMGDPGRVPDAHRLDPDRAVDGLPPRLSLDLVVEDGVSPDEVTAPGHDLAIDDDPGSRETVDGAAPGSRLRVTLRENPRLDRDVVVRWRAGTADAAIRLTAGAGMDGDDGRYALVTVVPPEAPASTFRRDLTLLLDASGSMTGLPLTLAKRIVRGVVDGLEVGDRFELLAFANSVDSLTGGLVDATPAAVAAALARLEDLRASGGTEMRGAMRAALRPLRPDAQRQVILITDGYIGFEREVVAEAAAGLPEGVRIHAVGVGAAPNRTLTGGLARAGRGREIFATNEEDAGISARLLHAATARPVLTELRVTGTAVREVAPARLPDVFAGQPALLSLELEAVGGTLELSGRLAGTDEIWRHRLEVPAEPFVVTGPRAAERIPIGALHGREVIADLELEEAAGADRREIDRKIEARAMRHRIVSRRTSLVAVADEPSVDALAPRRVERLAVELPAGVSAEGVGVFPSPRRGGMGMPVASAAPPYGARLDDLEFRSEVREAPSRMDYLRDAAGAPPGRSRKDLPRREFLPEWLKRRAMPDAPAPTPPPAPARWISAVVLHRSPDLVTVEIEVPAGGLLLPGGRVRIRLENGREAEAIVDGSRSTPTGPHPEGVRVRLALRWDPDEPLPVGRRLELSWDA